MQAKLLSLLVVEEEMCVCDISETVEIPENDFYIGVQYHPEFKSRPNKAHPLFKGLISAALRHAERG